MGKKKNKSGNRKEKISLATPVPISAPVVESKILEDSIKETLSLNLRHFNDKPHSCNDIAKRHDYCKSFMKFIQLLSKYDYGTLQKKGKFQEYYLGTKISHGFSIPSEIEKIFGDKKIVRVAPDGTKNPFRIFGYVVENYFCLLWIDPNHKAKG